MADEKGSSSPGGRKFSLFWSGGHEWGSREISFDGKRRFYYAFGDSLNSGSETGVGAFELSLQNSDLAEMEDAVKVLCDKDIQKVVSETTDPPSIFSVECAESGRNVLKRGLLGRIPEDLKNKLYEITARYSDRAYAEGKRVTKLDFSPYKIDHQNGSYIVSVKFVNSGSRWIRFTTPDQWPGTAVGGRLGIGAVSKLGNNGAQDVADSWAFALGGKTLLNKGEFQDGVVTLKPGETKILTFQTTPDNKAAKGEYEFSGVAFMSIDVEGRPAALSGHVILGPIKTRITIDRDYPATPQEREQWEATHRADMSLLPIMPGGTFAENGLYRAVRVASGSRYRSLTLKPFKAGDIATSDNVKMPMEQGNGVEINGPVQWVWEGSAPTPTSPSSFDCEDGTQHYCAPGAACPRSGRWIARLRTGPLHQRSTYRYDMSRIVALRRGQPMPATRADAGDTDWEWIGA